MRGSMRRRGDAWQLRVYAGRDPVTDRKRWVTRTVRGGKREAERELAAMVRATCGDECGTDTSISILLERWFDHRSPDWSPRTVVQHRHVIDHYLQPQFGSTGVGRLHPADIDAFYAYLRRAPGGPKLAPATVVRIHGVLRAALSQAVKWGWVAANVADRTTPPQVTAADIRPPAIEDLRRALALIDAHDHALLTFLRLAVVTGARRSQLLGIQWRDVDLVGQGLVFQRGVVDGPDGVVVKDTKSHRSYRVLLDDASLGLLAQAQRKAHELAAAVGTSLADDAFVFARDVAGTKPWRPDSATRRWTKLRGRAGLRHVRLHDLRHFAATSLLGAGIPVNIVAGRLGHARAATTLNVYAHFTDDGDRKAAFTLGSMLDGEER